MKIPIPDTVKNRRQLFALRLLEAFQKWESGELVDEEAARDFLRRKLFDPHQPGPTGEYPQGKLVPNDEGELSITLGIGPGDSVVLQFGTPVTWFAMPADQVDLLAAQLHELAAVARAGLQTQVGQES